MTWKEWALRHARIFCLKDEAGMAMLAEWAGIFARSGYTEAEAAEATDRLTARPPQYPNQHPHALQGALQAIRSDRYRRQCEAPAAQDRPRCELCGGEGWASVPHYRPEHAAKRATCAVYCCCERGRLLQQSHAASDATLCGNRRACIATIEQYEADHPGWRDLVERWREEDRAVRRAANNARLLDGVLGRLAPGERAA